MLAPTVSELRDWETAAEIRAVNEIREDRRTWGYPGLSDEPHGPGKKVMIVVTRPNVDLTIRRIPPFVALEP